MVLEYWFINYSYVLNQIKYFMTYNLQFDNCVAGTSNGTENIDLELENGPSKIMSKSNEIFKEVNIFLI